VALLMAQNPVTAVRLPRGLTDEVRAARPELADVPVSQLVRLGLLIVAGYEVADAIKRSHGNKRGPAPKAERERESAGAAA
jgi:hypothetical protein